MAFAYSGFIHDTQLVPLAEAQNITGPIGKMAPTYILTDNPVFLDWFKHFISIRGWGMFPFLFSVIAFCVWVLILAGKPKSEMNNIRN